jgi:Ran GTPase-activating protein (RanGAP) involved in mRNA processing and transport
LVPYRSGVTAHKAIYALASLNIADNDLGPEGIIYISQALQHSQTLTYLDVSKNKLLSEGVEEIAKAFSNESRVGKFGMDQDGALVALNLAENAGTDSKKFAVEVADLLKQVDTLTSIDLTGNSIDATGARSIADAILPDVMFTHKKKKQSLLTALNLSCNQLRAHGAQKVSVWAIIE